MPGFPVPHHLLELAQIHVHWVGDTRYMIHARYIASVHGYDFSLLPKAEFYVAGESMLLSFFKYFMAEIQVPTQQWYLEIQSTVGAPLLKKFHAGPDNQWSPGPTSLSRQPHWLFPWLVKVKVTQSCLTLCDPMDYTVHGILQARILDWVATSFSGGSSQPMDRTQVSHIADRFFTVWATRETREYWSRWPFPSSVDLPNPAIKLGSPALQADSLPAELPGKSPIGTWLYNQHENAWSLAHFLYCYLSLWGKNCQKEGL